MDRARAPFGSRFSLTYAAVSARAGRFVPLALIWAAFALRMAHLGSPSLWYDEAFCWWTTTLPWHKVLALSVQEIVPPLDYLLLRGWVPLAGASELALRFPSVLLGVLAVASAGRIARRLSGRGGEGAALLLFAVAPPLLWPSREVRLYSLAQGLTLLSSLALLETLFAPLRDVARRAWVWGVLTLASLYALSLSGFWLLGQAVFAGLVLLRLAPADAVRRLRALVAPLLLITLGFAPWLLAATRSLGANAGYWPGFLPLPAFYRTAIQGITVGKFMPPAYGGVVLLLAASASLLTYARPWAGLYALSYALPSLVILSRIYRTLPKWAPRHATLFAPAPFLALALAWGATASLPPRVRRGGRGVLLAGLVLIAPILGLADRQLLADPGHADWRGATAYVRQHRRVDEVVLLETGSTFPTWLYYAGDESLVSLPQETLLNVGNVLHYENTAPRLNEVLRGASGAWLVSWLGEVSDPTALVATLLADAGTAQPVQDFAGLTVQHFTFATRPHFPALPPTTSRPEATLLPHLRLWGVRLPERQPADRPLVVWLWWRTDDPAALRDQPYHVAARLRDALGQEWARLDVSPANGSYRPTRWPVDAPVLGRVDFALPPGTPPGTYTVTVRLYTEGASGPTMPVGRVQLTRPATPPPLPQGMRPISGSEAVPLRLLGVGLNRATVAPCETLSGRLFWEMSSVPPAMPPLSVTVGQSRASVPLLPAFDPQDWRPGDRFLMPFHVPLSCRALDAHTPLVVSWPVSGSVTWRGPLVHVKAARLFALPPGVVPLTATLGDVALLRGYEVHAQAGKPFTVTLVWQAARTTDTPYSVFVHVAPPAAPAPLAAQHDGWPGLGKRPTFGWVPGEFVVDEHPLPALAAGRYSLRVGMYGPDGRRLPLHSSDAPVEGDALALPLFVGDSMLP